MGCVYFADDERILVEPACGVSIATAYNGSIRELFKDVRDEEFKNMNVVVVVCGGSNVTLQTLESYKVKYGGDKDVAAKWKGRNATVLIK